MIPYFNLKRMQMATARRIDIEKEFPQPIPIIITKPETQQNKPKIQTQKDKQIEDLVRLSITYQAALEELRLYNGRIIFPTGTNDDWISYYMKNNKNVDNPNPLTSFGGNFFVTGKWVDRTVYKPFGLYIDEGNGKGKSMGTFSPGRLLSQLVEIRSLTGASIDDPYAYNRENVDFVVDLNSDDFVRPDQILRDVDMWIGYPTETMTYGPQLPLIKLFPLGDKIRNYYLRIIKPQEKNTPDWSPSRFKTVRL